MSLDGVIWKSMIAIYVICKNKDYRLYYCVMGSIIIC